MSYSYPGVYIEEIPSGVHAITGVSTSNTAFVDFFVRGPVDQAVEITSYGDFERIFGGLDPRSEASYSTLQYYLNGGQTAFVVRVLAGGTIASGWLAGGYGGQPTLKVSAANAGLWGNNLSVGVDAQTADPTTLFNLAIREVKDVNGVPTVVNVEAYRNLSMAVDSPRYAPTIVNNVSKLVTLEDKGIGQPPGPTGVDVIAKPTDSSFIKITNLGGAQPGGDGTTPAAPNSAIASGWTTTSAGHDALLGDQATHTGMYALDKIEPAIFNLLCIPAASALSDSEASDVYANAAKYCSSKRAFLIVDIPDSNTVPDHASMIAWMGQHNGLRDKNAAIYYPRLLQFDPLSPSQPRTVPSSGTLAGVYARTDSTRGVWKAPAGIEATLAGVDVADRLSDLENGELNPIGVNVLRNFPIYGQISWGARTLEGADQIASEWKYIPIRRLALFIEESLYEGTKWAVFEPNDEPLWAQLRMSIGTFMHDLFRREAFQGSTPNEAYFVKCDKDTTTSSDQDLGIVNVVVGFAPLKPAEFVVIRIQQLAGQSAS